LSDLEIVIKTKLVSLLDGKNKQCYSVLFMFLNKELNVMALPFMVRY